MKRYFRVNTMIRDYHNSETQYEFDSPQEFFVELGKAAEHLTLETIDFHTGAVEMWARFALHDDEPEGIAFFITSN